MPVIGMGTFKIEVDGNKEEIEKLFEFFLKKKEGWPPIYVDTAKVYYNEEIIGTVLKRCILN